MVHAAACFLTARDEFDGIKMITGMIATVCAGLFAGAAIYINLVEHPARIECGMDLALREFGPSYHRATIMQVPLAGIGFAAALTTWLTGRTSWWLWGGILLVVVIPYTLIAILPTNKKLLDPSLNENPQSARELLIRWGRLHAVRTLLSLAAFLIFAYLLSPT